MPDEDRGLVSLTTAGEELPKPGPGDMEVEFGVPMALPFSMPAVLGGVGWNRSGDEQILFRTRDVTIQQLVDMRRKDGQARALYRLISLPIRAAVSNCSFIPAEGDKGEAEFIENMLTLPPVAGGMTINFHRVMAQILLAVFDGFSAFEQVYWVPENGPLKGKITLKKLAYRPAETCYFVIDLNGNYRGFQQKCFSADTEVSLLDGSEVTIKELSERSEPFWVYSTDEVGKVVPGKARAKKTSDSEPLLEVTLDNGEKVKCTYTHPWRLRDGKYKRAADLKAGDSLMPLYRQRAPIAAGANDYEQVWHPEGWTSPTTGHWQWTHAMVDQHFNGHMIGGHVVHHKDVDRFNNDPGNLERLTKAEHTEAHKKLGQMVIKHAHAWWATPEGQARRAELAKQWVANRDPEAWSAECSARMRERWAAGVYPSGPGSRPDRAHPRGPYKKKDAPVNHAVVSVQPVEAEAVYDIEVEDYHNFALTAGVFVHNTVFQGRPIDVFIDAPNSFYYSANEEEAPFYGVSYFESAFYHYDKKVKFYYLAHLAAQNRAVGVRLGHMPPNANTKDKTAFRTALSNFGIAQAMLVPDGFTVEELGHKSTEFNYLPLIEHHDKMMSRSVLALFLDNDKTTRLVDFSTQQDDMFLLMERAIMDDVAAAINNYLIPKFIDWNFGSGAYPEFKWGAFTEEQKSSIRTIFNALAVSPTINTSPEFTLALEELMADQMGLEIDYVPIEQRMVVEQEQKEAAAKAQAMMAMDPVSQQSSPGTPKQTSPYPDKPPTPKTKGTGGGPVAAKAAPTNIGPKAATPAVKATATGDTAVITLSDIARQVLEDYHEEVVSE